MWTRRSVISCALFLLFVISCEEPSEEVVEPETTRTVEQSVAEVPQVISPDKYAELYRLVEEMRLRLREEPADSNLLAASLNDLAREIGLLRKKEWEMLAQKESQGVSANRPATEFIVSNNMVPLDDSDIPLWLQMVRIGDERYAGSDYRASAQFYRIAADLGCDDGAVFFRLGKSYAQQGDPARAATYYRMAIELFLRDAPNHPSLLYAYNNLGIVYRRMKMYEEAREAYENALQVDPGYANAYFNLGVLCDDYLNADEDAMRYLEKFVALKGESSQQAIKRLVELRKKAGSAGSNRDGTE